MLTSCALHVCALILLMLFPARALSRVQPAKPVDMVFYKPKVEIPAPPIPAPEGRPGPEHVQRPAAPPVPKPIPAAPPGPGKPEQPPGPEVPAKPVVTNVGILAFRDKFASLAQVKVTSRLGADARVTNADNQNRSSSNSLLTSTAPGSSGGIDVASLKRDMGGGGGGGGAGGIPGGTGVDVGRATSPIAPGGDRPLAHKGAGPARTDEEIQIVFDRYKAQFYRLYNRELRKDPTLKGQMVLRLTIEPDGSVSMCKLQSSDMNAPELADQVVAITKTINFGAKDGVQALTISYPIDFLPAS